MHTALAYQHAFAFLAFVLHAAFAFAFYQLFLVSRAPSHLICSGRTSQEGGIFYGRVTGRAQAQGCACRGLLHMQFRNFVSFASLIT
jgi:hypothetical protein